MIFKSITKEVCVPRPMSDIGLYFSYVVMSLPGFDIRVRAMT